MLIHVSLHPVALKGVVPTNYPATIEPYGLRRPKRTNALMANCCARAASGHAAAVPPSSAMNSRRFIVAVLVGTHEQRGRKCEAERPCRLLIYQQLELRRQVAKLAGRRPQVPP